MLACLFFNYYDLTFFGTKKTHIYQKNKFDNIDFEYKFCFCYFLSFFFQFLGLA